MLLCIEQGAHIDDPNRRRLTPEHYFKSAAEMRALFADIPEACDNTLVIAQRCAYMPAPRKPILPRYTKLEAAPKARRCATWPRPVSMSCRSSGAWPTGSASTI